MSDGRATRAAAEPLHALAALVRSQNAGPFWLTIDVMFRDEAGYRQAHRARHDRETLAGRDHVDRRIEITGLPQPLRCDTGGAEQVGERRGDAARPAAEGDGPGGKIRGQHGAPALEPAAGGNGDEQIFPGERLRDDAGILDRQPCEAKVRLSAQQVLALLLGGEAHEVELDRRVGLTEMLHVTRGEDRRKRRSRSPRPAAAPIRRRQPARASAAARAVEERRPGFMLEVADAAAERRLRNAQAVRRTGEAQFLGDRAAVSKLSRIHDIPLPDPARLAGDGRRQDGLSRSGAEGRGLRRRFGIAQSVVAGGERFEGAPGADPAVTRRGLSPPPSRSERGSHCMTTRMEHGAARVLACRICGATEGRFLEAREMMFGLRERFPYLECAGCGCVQIAEYPRDIARFYPPGYGAHGTGAKGLKSLANAFRAAVLPRVLGASAPLRRLWARSRPALALYAEQVPEMSAPILDVGSGTGKLLTRLREMGYAHAIGVDPFVPHDIHYRGRLLVKKARLEEMEGRFACISFHHSLEHMPDQHGVMREARRLLAPGGSLLVRIPVVGGSAWHLYHENWVQWDAPRHFYLHSVASLAKLAARAGFALESVRHDSSGFQFWGSELYMQDIPLMDPRSPARGGTFIPRARLVEFDLRAEDLNRRGQGDQIVAILRATDRPAAHDARQDPGRPD